MLKRILFAVIPMVLAVGTVSADDNLLAKLAGMNEAEIVGVSADLAEADFGKTDVDALLGEDEESGDDAIAACFRRIGYGYSHGYRHYNHNYNYNYGYNWCRPVHHHYTYYRPVPVYRPVYTCYTPIYTSYWGCF